MANRKRLGRNQECSHAGCWYNGSVSCTIQKPEEYPSFSFHFRHRYRFKNEIITRLTYVCGHIGRLLGYFFAATSSTPLAGVTNVTMERLGINKGRCIETSLQAVRFSAELVI